MTNQEAYDGVKAHLNTMTAQSIDRGQCRYRFQSRKCAIGALIPDDLYNPMMDDSLEQSSVISMVMYTYPAIRNLFQGVDLRLLIELQQIHDSQDNWNEEGFIGQPDLEEVASLYELIP